jgi:Flp pilus assembly protein TadD/mono/diheme cytochrome c family protein
MGSVKFQAAVLLAGLALATGCARDLPAPTFNKDIAPIVFANCAPCHRPAGAAPFPLLSYADVSSRADNVAHQTLSRHMPPWLPERGEFPIVGERRLTPEQIDVIQRWVKEGKAEGAAGDRPPAPAWPDGWELGRPDAVLTFAKPYTLKPDQPDVYRNFVLRSTLPSTAFVRAVEFRTNGAPVHHAVIRVDPTSSSRRRDGGDGQPGFDGMSWEGAQDPDGHFIGWAPGRGPIQMPDGMPWPLARGSDLVVELHMIPRDEPVTVQPSVALFLTDKPPVRTPVRIKLSEKLIDIPAGARDHVITQTYDFPVPIDLMSVYPHAHYLAREMLVTAALPAGGTKTLLHIKQWSFHWQQDYRYVTPISLPAGTRLTMRYTFDNSAENRDNPTRPPVRVRLGPQSVDEMADLGMQVLTTTPDDAARLAASFEERHRREYLALAESRVREEPHNAEYRAFLGTQYVQAGRFADAIPHLDAAIKLNPRDAAAHDDLGTALMEQGRLPEALAHSRRAIALDPRNEAFYFNLGNMLRKSSRPGEAAAAYQKALSVNPDFPDAHVNLGALLYSRGQVKEALPHFQRAVELQPNSAVLLTNLAGVLAASGRYIDAMQHVRRALALKPDYPPAIDTFKRLQQMGIR